MKESKFKELVPSNMSFSKKTIISALVGAVSFTIAYGAIMIGLKIVEGGCSHEENQ